MDRPNPPFFCIKDPFYSDAFLLDKRIFYIKKSPKKLFEGENIYKKYFKRHNVRTDCFYLKL